MIFSRTIDSRERWGAVDIYGGLGYFEATLDRWTLSAIKEPHLTMVEQPGRLSLGVRALGSCTRW